MDRNVSKTSMARHLIVDANLDFADVESVHRSTDIQRDNDGRSAGGLG